MISPITALGADKPDSSSIHSISDYYNYYKIPSSKPGINEFTFWGGYSFHSSSGVWGQTTGAKLGVLGLRYNRKLLDLPQDHLLKYVVEMNLFVHYELTEVDDQATPSSMSGFGMTPVGFQLNWWNDRPVHPFFKTSAGFMYLRKPFPDDRGTQFNFTLEVGGGVDINLTHNSFFTLGYKYHHMSNGKTGQINPGVDSNMFYAGITIY